MSTSSFYGNNPTPTEYRDIDDLIAQAEAAANTALTAGQNAEDDAALAETYKNQAAASAADSASSASASANSASTANTAKVDAQAAQIAAANSASASLNSANNSATSASNSASSATAASVSATNAAASESAAAASQVAAAASQTAAASSQTAAASSASAAAISQASAATSAANAATSETNAAAYELSANNWATKTSGPVAGSEYSAKYHAQAAASSASGAASSASAASSSASTASAASTAAGAAQVAAEAARDQTLAAYDNFDDRYLGAKATDPTVDNDGNALVAGTLYFDSTNGYMKVYTGSLWVDAYAAGTSFLAKANNLSDLPSVSTARTNLGLGTAALENAGYFAQAVHTHAISDVTNLQTSLDGKAALSHTHAISEVTNLQTSLDAKLNISSTNYVQQSGITGSAYLPAGSTGERPGTPAAGYIRYNTTTGKFEGYGSAWGNIGGGAAIGDTPPANPGAGDLWWNSADGRMYVYYTDANSSQWVDLSAGGAGQYLPLTGGTVSGNLSVTGNFTIGTNSTETGERLRVVTTTGNTALTVEANGVGPYIRLLDTLSSEWALGIPDGSSSFAIMSGRNAGSAGTERLRIDSSGKVGIGTNNPTNTLSVNGGITTTANDQGLFAGGTLSSDFGIKQQSGISQLVFNWKPSIWIGMGSDNVWNFYNGGGIAINGGHSRTSDFTYYAKGNPNNIGYASSNTVSDVSLYVSSRAWAREFNAHSDIRLKNVTETLSVEEAKYFVQSITPKKYRWKSEGEQGPIHIGLIAQDVAEAGFFGMLSTYDDQSLEAEEYNGVMQPEGKRLGLDYNQIAPLLMTLVKDLYKELDSVKAKLAQLKGGE